MILTTDWSRSPNLLPCVQRALAAICVASLLLVSTSSPIQAADAKPAAADWAAIAKMKEPSTHGVKSRAEAEEIISNHLNLLKFRLDDFISKYPDEPQRWDAELQILIITPQLDASFRRPTDWQALEEGYAKIQAAPKASKRTKGEASQAHLELSISRLPANPTKEQMAPVVAEAEKRINATEKNVERALIYVCERLGAVDPEGSEAFLKKLLTSKNKIVALWADSLKKARQFQKEPLDIAFTALDNRKVDLKELRGKIVLLNFWTVTIKDSPEQEKRLLAIYNNYKARGFEVIGVAVDKADDKSAVRNFVKKHNIPWPQHFDGKYGDGEIVRKCGVLETPMRWLINQQGLLVATRVTPADLEARIDSMLKQ